MKRILLLTAAIALGTAAYAQQGTPGGHFIEKWDMNEDGQVTLAEAIERRGDIFVTFDEDDDGFLSASDYAMFDQARANDHATMKDGRQGHGRGKDREGQGMTMKFNDVNGDGRVSRHEFMARTSNWYSAMDRNGDGTVTTADFGRGRG
ncbi:MAG: EF-hand domain-containing protein [Marinosulfonomonas sp.]|nr:EF-hand domain-containing protein [Marinosulfonomonas sp.]